MRQDTAPRISEETLNHIDSFVRQAQGLHICDDRFSGTDGKRRVVQCRPDTSLSAMRYRVLVESLHSTDNLSYRSPICGNKSKQEGTGSATMTFCLHILES